MRTLKKTLSLVLVVAMVLGLCVVGASATNKVDSYTDAAKVGAAYKEAVGVMTGLGIVDGVTDTELRPENTYQRDQAAKIIAYMLLGKAKADSLVCTVAPFEDVPANHWAAGYIAFCKEQGIIDGVTETTFNPTGTLTGFQWAKMLLCAVGFGVNGEFEGDSWSLNTAKVAHTVDLFEGDLNGADHVALQRQQAMLYAFNALTNVGCVVYSASLGDYIYSYNNRIFDRFTYEGTLGWNVWNLTSRVGIVVNNEGMGGAATTLSSDYTTSNAIVSVAADTGLDMMYHAARIWYTVSRNALTGVVSNTGVYVLDLATVKSTDCPSGTVAGAKQIGAGISTVNAVYQRDVVDNSAVNAGTVTVDFVYNWTTLGVRSTVNSTTVINGTTVANANIKTDISAINNGNPVIVLKATSQIGSGEAWYVYAPTATKGTVVSINNAKGIITLSDGTVLSKSNLATATMWSDLVAGKSYTFVLDTHGHWMYWDANLGVAYYTGTIRDTNSHDAWWGEAEFVAQFVNVTTGEVSEVPVTTGWALSAKAGGYYDLSDALYGTNKYFPVAVTSTTYGSFVLNSGEVSLGASTYKIGNVYYDPSNVTFIIATGNGSNLSVKSYVGFSALLAAYNKTGAESTVTLKNLAMTCTTTAAGNKSATVIFAYDGIVSTSGGFLFVAKNISADNWTWNLANGVGTWAYNDDVVYLNGNSFATDLVMANKQAINRGFYKFTIDANGVYTLSPLTSNAYVLDVNNMAMSMNGPTYYMTAEGTEYNITSWTVVDLRTGAGVAGGVDKIETVDALVKTNFSDYPAKVQIAFVPSVGVIYVVDNGLLKWNVSVSTYDEYTVKSVSDAPEIADTGDVTVTLAKASGDAISDNQTGAVLTFTVKVNGVEKTIAGTRNTDGTGSFVVEVSDDTTIEVTNVAWVTA